MTPTPGSEIAVWFSCGAASAVAAKLTIDKYRSTNPIRVLNNPIEEEPKDNRRFLHDCEEWFGREVELVVSSKYPDSSVISVWDDKKFMSSIHGAICTTELKKKARQEWEVRNGHNADSYLVMGFTVDEVDRYERFRLTERPNLLPVLIEAGLSKNDCFQIIREAGIALPDAYLRGYPNANCIGCVKATSPTYWNHVRKMDPDVFDQRAKQSRELGARLVRVKGQRIFLDELDPLARGRDMKTMEPIECGIFCEEQ